LTEHADEIIASKFRRLVELRDDRDEKKTAYDSAEEDYREYEAELYEWMKQSPIKGSRRIDLGEGMGVIVFTPRETYYGRILDKDKALKWFKERRMLPELTRSEIAKRKLNEIVRDRLESGSPMPDGVDFTANRGITISRKGGG
jgi:hypothetical protein